MMDSDSETSPDWRSVLATISISVGILLILLSLFWPTRGGGQSNWSPEQAKKYQAASVKLHSLAHSTAHASAAEQQASRKELEQAEAEYTEIRAGLDSAIDGPRRFSRVLRWTGVFLLAAGGLVIYRLRAPAPA